MLVVERLGGRYQKLEDHEIVGASLSYCPVFDSRDLCLGSLKNAFTYLPAPPPVPTAAALASGDSVKEWGTRPSESEEFCAADLDPFESMLSCSLRSYPPVGEPTVPKGGRDRRWSLGSSSPSRPPTKRVKVEVDTGSLDELIPLVLDDPFGDVVPYAYDEPPSPIMFPPLSSHRIPRRRLHHLMNFTPLSCRFRHKPRVLSRLSSRPHMPALLG
jgi:hypothetical protein